MEDKKEQETFVLGQIQEVIAGFNSKKLSPQCALERIHVLTEVILNGYDINNQKK